MPYLRNNFSSAVDSGEPPIPSKATKNYSSKMSTTLESTSAISHYNGAIEGPGEPMDGFLTTSSQPPSPPDSRSPTPRLTLMACPVRLLPLVPAPNYGTVVDQTIFRSAFPQARNLEFMESLKLKSILTLVTKTESCEHYDNFVWQNGIKRKILDVEPNKEGKVKTNFDTLCDAVLFALNPTHHPVYIHCNQGRHRTGCVVACIRKIQQWPMDEILLEYMTYADPKPRDGDIELIKNFDPELVHQYGRRHRLLKGFTSAQKGSGRERVDSFASVYELASSLPSHDMASIYSSSCSQTSECSETSEPPLLMARRSSAKGQVSERSGTDSHGDRRYAAHSRGNLSDVTASEVEDDDGLTNSVIMQGGEREMFTAGLSNPDTISVSATTPPIAIRGRS